ncbi:CopG family transcriptional regulator [bacterium]|nr:CopG family transcriptional regulator [bacterium]
MKKKPDRIKDIEEIAEKAQRGQDVSKYFTGQHLAKQRVNIDFPLVLLKMIDSECRRIGITRQGWIKMACDEKIRRTYATQFVKSGGKL